MKKSLSDKFVLVAVPWLASWLIRFVHLTMRVTRVGFESYRSILDRNERFILAFWHGRLMMMRYAYPGPGITVLISQSKDGELVARTMARFGIESVRGSTSRGSFGGVKGLLSSVRSGRDLAITPDGPRGPGMKAQMGIIQIAAKTGLPIIPVSFGAEKKKVFRSWDSFILPYPFTRGVFVCAEPVYVPRKASREEMEEHRAALERTLIEITHRADNFFTAR